MESSISVKDFLNIRDDAKFKLLSLSLSLAARRDNNIKKFHKTSKIKNIRIMFVKSYLSRGVCAAAGLDLPRTEAVGNGRACQRPRTSSVAKCFSCEGALAREIAFFKIFGNYCCVRAERVCRTSNARR